MERMGSQTREVISPREGQQGNWSPRCPVGARQASPDLLALAPCLHQDVEAWLSGSPCASGLEHRTSYSVVSFKLECN